MAQATAIAAKQDAKLMERARERRRQLEAKMREEERLKHEKAAAEARQKLIEEKKRQQALEQKKQQKRLGTHKATYSAALKPKTGLSSSVQKKVPSVTLLAEKKKPVHMSFDELMRKAKEQSTVNVKKTGIKSPILPSARKQSASPPHNKEKNTPSIYLRRKPTASSISSVQASTNNSGNSSSTLSARERAKQLSLEPPKKIISQKRDRQSISEVQRSLRHAKGIFSDDEDDINNTKPRDRRLMPRRGSDSAASAHVPTSKAYTSGSSFRASAAAAAAAVAPYSHSLVNKKSSASSLSSAERRKRPLSPLASQSRNSNPSTVPFSSNANRYSSAALNKKPSQTLKRNTSATASTSLSSRLPSTSAAPIRRMPFTGKPIGAPARTASNKRRHRDYEDEEEDEELASFIVSDDDIDEDPVYTSDHSRKAISNEISKIFRYDRSKYANEPVFSDDDMEANASEVLREEKRSARIARREDLIEEQKELERLKRRKKNNVH
ncbi:SPT2 chromatin protein-domain-containing protein [Mycotypha africana]|uniref:SPT2 chromatin protein-domain-containing protein n=1 Tax=Mycotypha africana TaxID=64632 RepID=UPI0022FFD97C|nr:SPT2 chromatin protein-domain-containing protein [Mycotypha africana]KAI8988552.1 SPT2 chromatin protein-domain-containing protein [Mycotypha africana]